MDSACSLRAAPLPSSYQHQVISNGVGGSQANPNLFILTLGVQVGGVPPPPSSSSSSLTLSPTFESITTNLRLELVQLSHFSMNNSPAQIGHLAEPKASTSCSTPPLATTSTNDNEVPSLPSELEPAVVGVQGQAEVEFVPQQEPELAGAVAQRRNSSLMCVDVLEQYQLQQEDSNDLDQYFQQQQQEPSGVLHYYPPPSSSDPAALTPSVQQYSSGQYVETAYLPHHHQQQQAQYQQSQQDHHQQHYATPNQTTNHWQQHQQQEPTRHEQVESAGSEQYYYNNQYFYQQQQHHHHHHHHHQHHQHDQHLTQELAGAYSGHQDDGDPSLQQFGSSTSTMELQTKGGPSNNHQHQHWTESSSESELLATNDHHNYYTDANQMQYLQPMKQTAELAGYGYGPAGDAEANENQQMSGCLNSGAYGTEQPPPPPPPPPVGAPFAEPFGNVSKYDCGGSVIEYYPSDNSNNNYSTTSTYRTAYGNQHYDSASYDHHYYAPPPPVPHATDLDHDRHLLHEVQPTEPKTYHLLKQSSQQTAMDSLKQSNYDLLLDDGEMKQMTELQPTTSSFHYYSSGSGEPPRVSRLYDPNTEINSSLLDDGPAEPEDEGEEEEEEEEDGGEETDGDEGEQEVEEEELEEEEVEEEEEEEEEASICSSSGSASTLVQVRRSRTTKPTNTYSSGQRSRPTTSSQVAARATTSHGHSAQTKLARCSPETIEKLRLFLQRRQQLRKPPTSSSLQASSAPSFRPYCPPKQQPQAPASRAQATNRHAPLGLCEKQSAGGGARPVVESGELLDKIPPSVASTSSKSSTNKSCHSSSSSSSNGMACAYNRHPQQSSSGVNGAPNQCGGSGSVGDHTSQSSTKANSLSSSPSSLADNSCDESSSTGVGGHNSTITTCHHHPTSSSSATPHTATTENRQLRNRTIVITSASSYASDQDNNARVLKRHMNGYGLETRSSKRRRYNGNSRETCAT